MFYAFQPFSLQETIFLNKYAYPGEENWKDCANRVSKAISLAESIEEQEKWHQKFYQSIATADFIPGGRILFGAGRLNYNMLNCYVLDPEDNVESIGKTLSDMYKISCAGGGVGFNFSKIRPKGNDIQNIKFSAPGAISVMQTINEIGTHVRAGKNRRTALMAILSVSHPDFLEFLEVKLNRSQLTNFNISVAITNRFIEAVENNEDWYFTYGGRHERYDIYSVDRISKEGNDVVYIVAKSPEHALGIASVHFLKHYEDTFTNATITILKARDLWVKVVKNAMECGEPGIFNIDFSNSYTNVSYFEDMPATNPCGEEVLPAYGNCCLGHINLANMVEDNGEIDWKKLAKTIRVGVRFLDNVLTTNTFPIPECREVGFRSRRIGLGVTGFHYFLIKAGYKYGDERCLEFTERLFSTIRDEAYKASMYLAREKGSFKAYDFSQLKREGFFKTIPNRIRADIKRYGLRNAVILTVAPTGTISMVAGVSTGIEPIFSPVYKRRWRSGTEGVWNETIVIDPLFRTMYLKGKNLDHIVGAYDVSPEEHIKMQSAIQSYIDSAISKTCNLPETFQFTDETSDFLLQYISEIKGFTFYKAGSRGNEPLSVIDWRTIDLDKLIVEGKMEVISSSVESCKTGVCEL